MAYTGYKPEMSKAVNKYQQENLEVVSFRVRKGMRQKYNDLAKKRGVSLTKLLEGFLDEELKKEENKACE